MAELIIKKRHARWIEAVAWSPDGQCLVSGCDKERAQVWNVATGKTRVTHVQDGLRQAVWFPDGTRIATTGVDRAVEI